MAHCNYNGPIGSYPRDVTSPGPDQQPGSLFDGPSLPQPTNYCPPPADVAAWTLARIHQHLGLATDLMKQAIVLSKPRTDLHRAIRSSQCFVRALHHLAEADKILCEYVRIPHNPAQFALLTAPLKPADHMGVDPGTGDFVVTI